jgi:membrane protease YdiL (CAAX protease family)
MSNSSSDLVKGATALSGRELLAVLGVWVLLSAAAGAVTMLAARRLVPDWGRDGGALIPLVVAEVYASVVVAAAMVLGRRLPAVIALNRAPGHAFTLACVGVVAYGATAGIHVLLAPLIGAWSDVVELLRAIGSDDRRLATAGPGVAAIILLRACCLAPLGEELLFRGALSPGCGSTSTRR